jgi:hypothetical protein
MEYALQKDFSSQFFMLCGGVALFFVLLVLCAHWWIERHKDK